MSEVRHSICNTQEVYQSTHPTLEVIAIHSAVSGRNLENSQLPQTGVAASTLEASIWITEVMIAPFRA